MFVWCGIKKKTLSSSTCGLVAMTSASHAEGRQFDPGQALRAAAPRILPTWIFRAGRCVRGGAAQRPQQKSTAFFAERWGAPGMGLPRRIWSRGLFFVNLYNQAFAPRPQPLSSFRAGGEGLGDQIRLNVQGGSQGLPPWWRPFAGRHQGSS